MLFSETHRVLQRKLQPMNSKLAFTAAVLAVVFSIISSFMHPILVSLGFVHTQIPGAIDNLQAAELVSVNGAVGPESLAFDFNGEGPYTGVADGRILKWEGDGRGWTEFAVTTAQRKECVRPFAPELEHVCGRPLGIRFDKNTGDLYIADAYLGLQVVGPAGGLATKVVTTFEGRPLLFTNDMDIDEDEDVIYFTDTSTNFQRRQFMSSLLSGDKTGRLLKYDKSTKEVKVLIEGIAFANGVALSKDKSFVLVAETTSCRILRLWLKGSNAGKVDVFAEIPGYPDNIRRNPRGEFWVALHAKRVPFSKWLTTNSLAGNTLLKLPLSFKQIHTLFIGLKPHASAIKLSEEGEILEVLEDFEGKKLRFISEVEEKDGKLWIGSVLMPFVGVYGV